MQDRLFKKKPSNQDVEMDEYSISPEDQIFLENMLDIMKNYQADLQKDFDDFDDGFKAPELLKRKRAPLEANLKRMETLKKILKNQPITQEEQEHALKQGQLQDSIVSHYHRVAPRNVPKPS